MLTRACALVVEQGSVASRGPGPKSRFFVPVTIAQSGAFFLTDDTTLCDLLSD